MHINRKRQSDSESALTNEAQTSAQEARSLRRSMRYSLQRVGLACFGVLGTIGLLALAACPANLENPDQVIAAAGAPAAGGGMGTAGSGDGVDLTCITPLITKSCANSPICHLAGAMQGGGLDLSSPNFASRLVDVAATHKDVIDPTTCMASKLIDTADATKSWLLAKINGTQGACGSAMPIGPALSNADKACMTKFVNDEVAAHASSGTAGAAAAGASSGGSGGASAGSGGM